MLAPGIGLAGAARDIGLVSILQRLAFAQGLPNPVDWSSVFTPRARAIPAGLFEAAVTGSSRTAILRCPIMPLQIPHKGTPSAPAASQAQQHHEEIDEVEVQ